MGAVLLGAPAGLLWSVLAPRAEVVRTDGETVYPHSEPSAVIAADGWFTVVTAVSGLVCGAAVYLLGRRHLHGRTPEIATLAGLSCGGLLGSLTAARVGELVAATAAQQRAGTSSPGTHIAALLELHALGFIVIWPIVAVIVFTVVLALRTAGRKGR